jgi:hypothetical protein
MKIVRLTESDLTRLIKKVINESKEEESFGDIDIYKGSIKYNDKEIEYTVVYDWNLGKNGKWDWEESEIIYDREDISEKLSDDDVKEIKKAIVKKIKK